LLIVFFCIFVFTNINLAQQSDFMLLKSSQVTAKTDYTFDRHQEDISSIKFTSKVLLFPITIYQKVISPQFSSNCQYYPSCSHYGKMLIHEYGFFKGLFLTTDRLTRCNEISVMDAPSYRMSVYDHKIHEDCSVYKWRSK
ncbi:membrane protein insertion efficiency factor YidD, partial [candidate division KSB1 bacterium]